MKISHTINKISSCNVIITLILIVILICSWNCVTEGEQNSPKEKDDSTQKNLKDRPVHLDSTYGINNDLIGKIYNVSGLKNRLKGYKYHGGGVISSPPSLDHQTYSVSRCSKDTLAFWILEKKAFRDTNRIAYFKILDALVLPTLEKNDNPVIPSGSEIKYRGKPIYNIVAVGKANDSGYISKFDRAWIVDKKRERFQEISTEFLTCQLDGY